MLTIIEACRPWGGELSDLHLADGRISAVVPHSGQSNERHGILDADGRLVLPSFTDTHCHLDSNRVGLPFRPHTGGPGVWGMMLNDRNNWRDAETSITQRTADLLGLMIARGTTRVRSFAQVDVDCGLERLEAVLSAKDTHRDSADVQVVAFPQAGLLREDGSVRVLEDALRAGAQVVGGIDPCALDRDPAKHLDIVFDLAERYQVPVDIHLHEPGELGRFSMELIIERTEALGMQGNVLISHAYGLFSSEASTGSVIEALARAGIALSTVAPGTATPLPLKKLVEAGVRVGLGQDGQRDYWSPYGNGDMLDRTWQLAFTQGVRDDDLVEHCLAVATMGGRSIIVPEVPALSSVTDRPGLGVGDPADLVLLPGESVTSAVMDRPAHRTVLRGGVTVADKGALVDVGRN